ncbi:sugar ABC transporter permease [Vibrio cholerae]
MTQTLADKSRVRKVISIQESKQSPLEIAEERLGWKLIAPGIGIIAILILYPIIFNGYLSFFDVRLDGSKTFIGFANYMDLLTDSQYYRSWGTTLIYLIGTVSGISILGMAVALLLNERFPLRNLVRALILLPYFAPVISVVFGWQFIFDPVNGIYNYIMVDVLGIVAERKNLIGDPSSALWVVILFDIWKHFPIATLLILSQLQSIPKDQYEAAALDGYGAIGRFIHVTLPNCYFVLGTVVILRLIWNFNKFEEIYLLAPNVETLSIFTYYKAFTGVIDQGLAASASMLQFAALAVLIYFYVKKVLKW